MPTYDYECTKCGRRFEQFQNMTDKPVRTCSECGGRVRRLIGTGGAVIVKGAGGSSAIRCGRDTTCCGRDTPCGQCDLDG